MLSSRRRTRGTRRGQCLMHWVPEEQAACQVPVALGRSIVETEHRYFDGLNARLGAMPPGSIDMVQIESNERLHGHRFFDPPETVRSWLLDQQRRVQARWPRARRQGKDGTDVPQPSERV